MSPTLEAMIKAGTPLVNNPYRLGSEMWGQFVREARRLYVQGILDDVQIEDLQLLESDTGELIGYHGKTVMLGIPYENFDEPGMMYSFYMDGEDVVRIEYPAVTPA